MKFKIDENLPVEVAEVLRHAAHDACTVLEQQYGGRPDAEIASLCQHEERILITLDKDFANIRMYPPERYAGIIVLRVKQQDKPSVLKMMQRVLLFLPNKPLEHHLWIVEETRIRIRGQNP